LGSVRSALWKAEGDTGRLANVAYGGGIAAVTILLGGVGLFGAIAYNLATVPTIGPAATLTIFSVVNVAFTVIWIPTAVFIGATSVVTLRNKALPSWIGVLGIGVAAACLAEAGSYRVSGSAEPGGTLGTTLFLIMNAWVLVTSIALVARIGTVSEPKTIYLDQPQRERLTASEEM